MITADRYFGEAAYKQAKRIEDYRERARFFTTPSYMTPTPTTFPRAELGLCCPDKHTSWHQYAILRIISHNLP